LNPEKSLELGNPWQEKHNPSKNTTC